METGDQLRPLSELKNYKVSDEDPDVRGWTAIGTDGERIGDVRDLLIDMSRMKAAYFVVDGLANQGGGEELVIPAESATLDRSRRELSVNGSMAATGADWARNRVDSYVTSDSSVEDRDVRLTRAEEEVRIGKREVAAGEVVVAKHVETERVSQEVPLEHERVRVERRVINDDGASADFAANEIRIPIMEEELVVEKRAVVKEELVISKERVSETERVDTEVRKEQFDIEGDADLVNDSGTRRRDRN